MSRFSDQGTEDVYNAINSKAARRATPAAQVKVARRKLLQVIAATKLSDLAVPPNNKLELHKESGKYNRYHSIRINDQYRILFRWTDAGAMDIVIDDYHN